MTSTTSSRHSVDPVPGEHAFDMADAIAVLERTPDVLAALLTGLSDSWSEFRENAETWSPYDVMGHLIHGEQTDWIPRARIILAGDESRTFEPFDRFAQEDESQGKSMDDLIDEFAGLRRENLAALDELDLTTADLDLRARHPELGPVTLRQLLATWVAHDLAHIRQVSRTLARRYARDVGPWRAYMPVMGDG